jgi:hypothetical protein
MASFTEMLAACDTEVRRHPESHDGSCGFTLGVIAVDL